MDNYFAPSARAAPARSFPPGAACAYAFRPGTHRFYTFILLCLGGACFETEKSRADHRYRSGRSAGHLAADDPLCRPGLRRITPGRPLPSLPRRCAAGRFFLSAHIGCAAWKAAGSFCTHCVGGNLFSPAAQTGAIFAPHISFSLAAKQAFFAHSVGGERLHPTFLFLCQKKKRHLRAKSLAALGCAPKRACGRRRPVQRKRGPEQLCDA